MPIKAENKRRYPSNWKEIRERILLRANNRCEICGVENHSMRWNGKKNVKIALTIAHIDETVENCDDSNLLALCQKCHLSMDAKMHAQHAAETREKKMGQTNLFDGMEI